MEQIKEFADRYLTQIQFIGPMDIVEIILISLMVYYLLIFIRNTRAWQLLKGVFVILVFLVIAEILQMDTILWIARTAFQFATIALIVVLQPELRKALEQLGQKNLIRSVIPFESSKPEEGLFSDRTIREIVKGCVEMSRAKTGALIVVRQLDSLAEYERTGIAVDGIVTSQLLINIFEKNTPLHDGAVIVQGNRVTYATCYLPLSDNMRLSKDLGTRHRAGDGISEVTDSRTGRGGSTMKSKLMHNLGLKIMAVLISVVLWMLAVDINDPVINKYINNVQVQLTNTGALTGQGKTYRVVDNSDTIRVSVRAPKSAISAIDAQSVTAKADLSEITDDGRVPIELSLSSGLDVEKITSDRQYVQLQVENKKTRQLSIEVAKNGTLPDGYATGRIDMETNTLSISGPESAVNAVSRAVVDISLDNVTANVEIDATIRLLDADGNEITSSEIRKNVDSVKVTVPILETKEVTISASAIGEPADGYEQTGTVTVSPATVKIAGRAAVLDKISEITIPAEELDLTDATAPVTNTIDIREYLPSDISLADADFDGTVTVSADIEQIRRKTISFDTDSVQLLNIPDGWLAEAVSGQNLQLTVRGLQDNLNHVDAGTITPHADLSALIDENGTVTAGEQEVTVKFLLPASVDQVNVVTMQVHLTQLAASNTDEQGAQ